MVGSFPADERNSSLLRGIQTASGNHKAFYRMESGGHFLEKNGPTVNLITHLHLATKLRVSGYINLFPICPCDVYMDIFIYFSSWLHRASTILNPFYYQLMHIMLKNAESLKHSKLDKNAPTCFGLHRNQLKCNMCSHAYVGQSGRPITTRHREHIRYIRNNSSTSAYATHILDNRHEFGPAEETLKLLKPCSKGSRMDCWESLFIHLHHRHNILIDEQQANDNNPLFELASIPRDLMQHA